MISTFRDELLSVAALARAVYSTTVIVTPMDDYKQYLRNLYEPHHKVKTYIKELRHTEKGTRYTLCTRAPQSFHTRRSFLHYLHTASYIPLNPSNHIVYEKTFY